MKLTTILILSACLAASAAGTAQTIKLDVKDAPLEKVFAEIKKQAGYSFVYYKEDLAKGEKITLRLTSTNIDEVLQQVLKNQPLSYKIVDQVIVISKQSDSGHSGLDPESFSQLPPPIDIKGRIIDENGKPVIASVQVKGTNKGTTTNDNGEFELKGVDDNATLVISGVSIESFEVKVGGRSELALNAKVKTVTGENINVVVSTGYQQIPKERATGSFVQIDNELLNRRVSPDILSRLQGIASGLLFDNTSGNPLGISIRGRSTIFANTQPLIVVDNFPYYGDINSINPNNVESVTLLKDAAASSIWGAKSGNGVIVITTKKGRYDNSTSIEFNSNVSVSEKPNLFYSPQFLSSNQFIEAEKFLFDKGFYATQLSNVFTYPVITPSVEIFNDRANGTITQTQADEKLNELKSIDIRNDQAKYLYQKGIKQQYAINLRGGGEKINYFFSTGYDKNKSNQVRDESERITIDFLTNFKPFKNLELTAGTSLTANQFDQNSLSSLIPTNHSAIYPYAQLADENGNALPILKSYRASFVENPPVQGLLDWSYFPINDLKLNQNKTRLYDTRITTGGRYTIIKGLSVEARFQYQKGITQTRNFYDASSYFVRDLVNQFSTISGSTVSVRNVPLGAIYYSQDRDLSAYTFRTQASYNKTWNDNNIFALAGYEVNEQKVNGNSSYIYGYNSNTGTSRIVNFDQLYTVYPVGNQLRIPGAPSIDPYTLDRFRSYFANASYNYKRYTLSGSARIDQSNLFGVETNQKSIPLWSAGLKWDIDKEKFYRISWLPYLKLRATHGYNGNTDNAVTAFTTIQYVDAGGNLLNGVPFAQIPSPGNPELRWERISMLNVGADFQTKGEVLSGSIEYFTKKGIDMIGDAILPSSTGYTTIRGNFSNMRGQGFDVVLKSLNINRAFKWNTSLLFSMATDKVTKNQTTSAKVVLEGRPVNGVYSYKWGGLDNIGDPLGYLGDTLSKNYSSILSEAAVNQKIYLYSGPANPKFFGGLLNNFSYKNFSLSFNITFKAGYYFRRSSISYSTLYNSWLGHADFAVRWKNPGDENSTSVPKMVYIDYPDFANRDAFYLGSSTLVEKGDHIRLQDINFGYQLSKNQFSVMPFKSIYVYMYLNNLGILWKANEQGIDPDYQNGYPTPKSFSIGFKFNL